MGTAPTRPRPPNNVRLTASSVRLLINVFHSASLDYIRAMLMVGQSRIYFAWQLIDCCLRNFMSRLRR